MAEEIKLTGYEKLKIINSLLDYFCGVYDSLHLQSYAESILGEPRQHSYNSHTYSMGGAIRRTQTANLLQKLEELYKKQPEEVEQRCEEPYRYYSSRVRCFRCKRLGHYSTVCLDEHSCAFCLSSHHCTERCPQKTVCYQCYHYGHVLNECTATGGTVCNDCKRKHAPPCAFLTKGIYPIKQMFSTDYLFNHARIRCIKCLQFGHMICH